MIPIISSIGSVLGSVLGIGGSSDTDQQTIGALQQKVTDLEKSLKNFKLGTYLFGSAFLITLILYLRKK